MPGIRDLTPIMVTFGVAGIMLVLAGFVLSEVQDTQQMWTCTGATENLTLITGAVNTTTNAYFCTQPTIRCNLTMLTPNVDYTTSGHTTPGGIVLINNTFNNTLTGCEINYTYDTRTGASYNTTQSVLTSFASFAGWFALLALMVVAAIIIGLLIRSFSGGAGLR